MPIETYTNKAEVIEVCKLLGHRKVSQVTAQAATWHLQDGLSFKELARIDKVRSRFANYVQKWFTQNDLVATRTSLLCGLPIQCFLLTLYSEV